MSADGPELLAVALSLAIEVDDFGEETAIEALVEASGCSPSALMGAYAYGLSLAREQPYDASNERTLGFLTRALQRAVRLCGEHQAAEGASLLELIVQVAGSASVTPTAVASRTAEVDADIDHLRPSDDAFDGDAAAG